MANYGKRVSVYTPTKPDPIFKPTPEDFERLEATYRQLIGMKARRELIKIAKRYITFRIAELNADAQSEVVQLFEVVRLSFRSFKSFAYGSLIPRTDAGRQLTMAIEPNLRRLPVPVPQGDAIGGDGRIKVVLSMQFLMEVAVSLEVAIDRVKKDLDAEEASSFKGFVPGSALPDWLVDMRKWAMKHGYRYGALTNGQTSRFSKFLFNLIGQIGSRLPESHQETINSADALAEHLRKAIRQARRPA